MSKDFDSLRAKATIREWDFRSSLPIFGRLVAFVRRSIHAIAGKWALRLVIQQQSDFNQIVVEHVQYLERQAVENDRASLEMRRALAELRIALRRDLAALGERLDRLEAAWTSERGTIEADRATVEHLQREIARLRANNDDIFGLIADLRRGRRIEAGNPGTGADRDGATVADASADQDGSIDYFLFEMRYRGSPDEIKRRQEKYLQYFQSDGEVLDLGCGRGEFLKLLIEHGITARGVELDPDMVDYCRQNGLPVEMADLSRYLAQVDDNSLGGIFLGQVVEHLPPPILVKVVHLAHRKLKPDAHFVAETINPMCLLALTTHYLMDLSHVRPVHPEVLRFLLQSAGFREVAIHFSEPVPDEVRLKRFAATDTLSPTEQAWLPTLNENVDRLNDFLYGHQDYYVAARKFAWPERLASTAARRDLLAIP